MSYEIVIGPATETGDCTCSACDYAEHASSHAEVAAMRARAAEHVIVAGHEVTEHTEELAVVRPRSLIDY